MNYWLVKTEPSTWSWQDQLKVGTTKWDGVRNYQARNNMRAMKVGDLAFFYHSIQQKSIVGIVEVVKPFYPDPEDKTGKFGLVDVRVVQPLKHPVTLEEIKANPQLQNLPLIRQSRLSVMPISKSEWDILCKMGSI